MLNILKYLKKHVGMVLLIICLLIVQAACDLNLPQYMSRIVDVGIQQSGVERVTPDQMRPETLEALTLFLSDEEEAVLRSAYETEGDLCRLTVTDGDQLDQLDGMLRLPMAALYQMGQQGMTPEQMTAMAAAAPDRQSVKAQIAQSMETMTAQLTGVSDTMLDQTAILFVQQEYTATGVDLNQLQQSYLISTGTKMLGLTLLMIVMAILASLLASRVAATVGMELRGQVFRKVISFSNAEIDRFSTASLITRSTNDIQQVQMVMVLLLRMVIYAPILGIGGVIQVASTGTGMGWIIALAVGIILVVVAVLMRVAMPKFKIMQTMVDRLNLVSRETLTGLSVIRAFSREKYEEERFEGANRDLMRTQLFTNRTMSMMMPLMMLIMNGICVLIVWAGAHGIDLGTMQVGDMMAFITYTMQIVMSFLLIAVVSIMLPRAGVSASRIQEVLDTPISIQDPEEKKNQDQAVAEWKGEVTFEDVSFRYPDAQADVLEHISFTAKPGQTTAIIGSTGSGKSTLLNLIPRFFDVSYGRITIDGVDIRRLSQHKLHELMGYVPQKGVLFSGDITSNLKFGGEDISDFDMVQAARIAQAESFIDEKPEGYKAPIAQGGSNVSGGQKQRLSIARALAKKPKIVLFDDSFSALDYKTDVALRRALSEELTDVTVIIVAQRISTILHAQQIIVLDEGKVAGIGDHETLMRTCPTYQEIARSQLSESELGGVAQ
ncbi:MAG TPA: ABC transporter ATP-binding protein/permease [Candidatus Flavonifractor merdipullorum]|uniref:ABC transporter ATP-binding protein/permease n=1 Tax=Candidatus Flavonifractor merdipullorum TaxID=2838590 RepID=A0A9D1RV31_9FIRM|nr:ABC transporter ATP-binding protein/permease [Candidatus Flavonifractor merdipullorum]